MSGGNENSFNLISAIAMKEASTDDIARHLRSQGVNSVEEVVDLVRRTADERSEGGSPSAVDFRKFSVPSDCQPRRDTVQQKPQIPVLIDGTLYDPADIRRFDGQELHFVVAPDRKSMLAITDKSVISKWWEMTYISSVLSKSPFAALAGLIPASEPRLPLGPMTTLASYPATVVYYEHVDFGGWTLSHDPNRGYADLTRVHMGIFGWGSDWNDKISSVSAQNVGICVLHEHILWAGQTMTLWSYTPSSPEGPPGHPIILESNLHNYGWGDRASSVEGW